MHSSQTDPTKSWLIYRHSVVVRVTHWGADVLRSPSSYMATGQ